MMEAVATDQRGCEQTESFGTLPREMLLIPARLVASQIALLNR